MDHKATVSKDFVVVRLLEILKLQKVKTVNIWCFVKFSSENLLFGVSWQATEGFPV
jgi:hypothetical protein